MILRPKGRIGYNQGINWPNNHPPITTMIREPLTPEQARLWASLLGQQAANKDLPVNQENQPPVLASSLRFLRCQPTVLAQLLHRLQAQRETRKNLQAQEFIHGG